MKIVLATTPKRLNSLYRFRYEVHVEEMKRRQKYADHDKRIICDPLDETAYNLIALDCDGLIVGCLRVSLCRDSRMDYYNPLCRMQDVGGDHPRGTSLCTRLMVAPRHRRSALAVQLAYAGYNLGLENDIIWNLVDCNDHLVPFFDRLGYEWTHRAYHDEYGVVNVMRLKINDRERLMEKRSVFVKHSRYFEELRTRGELAAGGMHV